MLIQLPQRSSKFVPVGSVPKLHTRPFLLCEFAYVSDPSHLPSCWRMPIVHCVDCGAFVSFASRYTSGPPVWPLATSVRSCAGSRYLLSHFTAVGPHCGFGA